MMEIWFQFLPKNSNYDKKTFSVLRLLENNKQPRIRKKISFWSVFRCKNKNKRSRFDYFMIDIASISGLYGIYEGCDKYNLIA